MPIYIRKKNVKIFKICQNCRNDVQKTENENPLSFFVFRFSFFVFRFMHKKRLPATRCPPYVWINEVSLRARARIPAKPGTDPEHPRHTLRTPPNNSLTGRNPTEHP